MSKLIKHTGVVSQIVGNDIIVDMERSSACASCESKSVCLAVDTQTQQIRLTNDNYNLKTGDIVNVILERSYSIYAVALAFAVPLFLLMLTIIIMIEIFNINEGISALAAIAIIAVYYVIIHFLDYKIKTKIKFRIEKQFN
ncbi:MAG: SoxR reducing system RseC family protein [Prevotellaceae bacterium]|nr:SoxR reducing system RseC family protein [Prevotellaceae bacterium]